MPCVRIGVAPRCFQYYGSATTNVLNSAIPLAISLPQWGQRGPRGHHRIDNVDTFSHNLGMTKARPSSSDLTVNPATPARPAPSEAKGSINLRIEAHTRTLIDEAAAMLGKTRTEFMIDSARSLAIDVLLDQRLFVLDPDRHDAFIRALDSPPEPGPRLRALLRRVPAWES